MFKQNDQNIKQYITKINRLFQDRQKAYEILQEIGAIVSAIDEKDIQSLAQDGIAYSRVAYTDEDKSKRRVSMNSIFNNGKKLAIILHLKDIEQGTEEEQIGLIVNQNGLIQNLDYKIGGDYDIEELYDYEKMLKKASLYKNEENSKGLEKLFYKIYKYMSKEEEFVLMNEEELRYIINELKRITGEEVLRDYKELLTRINDRDIRVKQNTIQDVQQAYNGMTPEEIAKEEQTFHIRRSQITMRNNKNKPNIDGR